MLLVAHVSRALPIAGGLTAAMVLASCSGTPTSPNLTAATGGATPTPTTAPASSGGGAAALQSAYVAAVRKMLPSVVQIETSSGLGSGIVFDSKGDIVTNNHVVAGATSFTVTTSAAKKYQGTLVGTFPADDLAVIHVSNAALTPASFADSSKLEVGDIVMAIGNPLGLQSSVTAGIVSATGRTVSEDNGVVLPDTIQTSAEINPGNSGGALVDLNANVVGIPTLAAVDQQLGGSAPGIGFAIPSNIVTSIAAQLINQGHVTHSGRAYLGVRIALAASQNGALISTVTAGSPAAAAGLQAGDTITALNGKSVASPDDLSQALAQLTPGDKAQVTVTGPDGSQRTVTVTLGELPA
ncbi:MAG TPA: trypsin-like peptidase domain-containing protein [Candidatus Acidoferrales bacterium]|jgi:putative serine protease PepD|nr:trypsin-like peptidase domain-containing protein [Candidatus Acidoferrales bacterium]